MEPAEQVRLDLNSKRPEQCTCLVQTRLITELASAVARGVLRVDEAVAVYMINYQPDCQGMIKPRYSSSRECQLQKVCGHAFGKDHLGILATRISRAESPVMKG